MEQINILYIEDDLTAAKYVVEFLEEYGFRVQHTDSIASGISYVKTCKFDLILLDLHLPDFDGFELLKNCNKNHAIPIIVISAISNTSTKIKAFRYGAIDYMVKPIDLLELEARIWVHLGKFSAIGEEEKKKELFYIENGAIYLKDKIIDFTPIEFEIFEILLKNRNRTISRERLANALSSLTSHRTLDYHIKNIRKKIGDESKNPTYLKTEYGMGYKLVF